MNSLTFHEDEPTAQSSTHNNISTNQLRHIENESFIVTNNLLPNQNWSSSNLVAKKNPIPNDNENANNCDNEDSDFVDVNLSQFYLNDDSIGLIIEQSNTKTFPEYSRIVRLNLAHNDILQFPEKICLLRNLIELDLSNNKLVSVSDNIGSLTQLQVLCLRNNTLENLPKSTQLLRELRSLNLSGNVFDHVPSIIFELDKLVELQLGANHIKHLPPKIGTLTNLEILYLGGNRLTEVPATLGRLTHLTSLILADNNIETLPPTIVDLQSLQSITLHNNKIRALPTGIARLQNLHHLSLRNNPLVTNFIEAVRFTPPSLKELSARVLKVRASLITEKFYTDILPADLQTYLASANQCVNPRCRGVYFESCAELVKFVDFCGKYRVPLMQYLCTPNCTQKKPMCAYSDDSVTDEEDIYKESEALQFEPHSSSANRIVSNSCSNEVANAKMKKILLG